MELEKTDFDHKSEVKVLNEEILNLRDKIVKITSAADRNSAITSKVTRQNREYVQQIAFLENELKSHQEKPLGENVTGSNLKRKLDEKCIFSEDLTKNQDDAVNLNECSKKAKIVTMENLADKSSENFQSSNESGLLLAEINVQNQKEQKVEELLVKPTKPVLSAAELVQWLRASDYRKPRKNQGEKSFKVLHECNCWIVFVAINHAENSAVHLKRHFQKTFLFRKMKNEWFIDDHDEDLCKAEFKWANDDHEIYKKAYRLQDCQGRVSIVGTPRPDEILAETSENETNWKMMTKKSFPERDLNELNKLGSLYDHESRETKNEKKRKMEEKNQRGVPPGVLPIFSAVELLNWLRASEKKDGERTFEVLHECSCWILFVSINDDTNCPLKNRKKTFVFRKMKNERFLDDHDKKLCKAEFKWASDDDEVYHKAYRLQDCQGTVSFIGTPRTNQVSKNSGTNEKLWKKMAKKNTCERDLSELNKLGSFFDYTKEMRKFENKKMRKMEKTKAKKMKKIEKMNQKNNQNEIEIIPDALTKNQGPLNVDSSQATDNAKILPECSQIAKFATMSASTDESSENFLSLARMNQPTKPILSATELLNWLHTSDYGRATEKHGAKSFEVLHECSCWIVFVANGQKSFLFRKMKNQSFTDDHDETLCNAEFKYGEGNSRAYRLQNCQGTMSGVGVPLADEIKKNWKKMVKNVNIQGEIKELNKFGNLYVTIQSNRSKKKEKKRKTNQKPNENNSTTN